MWKLILIILCVIFCGLVIAYLQLLEQAIVKQDDWSTFLASLITGIFLFMYINDSKKS